MLLSALLSLSVWAAAFHVPTGRISARRSLRMNAAEDEAKRLWLERQSKSTRDPPPSPPGMSQEELYAAQRAARARIRGAMEGNHHDATNGVGAAYGFGVDDEDYGYGSATFRPTAAVEDPFTPSWLGDDPVRAKDLARSKNTGGFDGRDANWRRRAEIEDPNPPPMENTLRGPAPGATAAQSYVFDYSDEASELRELDAQEEETALINALMGTESNTTQSPPGAYDNTQFWR